MRRRCEHPPGDVYPTYGGEGRMIFMVPTPCFYAALSPAQLLLFEFTQAYIERRFAERGTPTMNRPRMRTIRDATGKPDPAATTGTFHVGFAFRPQQSPLCCHTPFTSGIVSSVDVDGQPWGYVRDSLGAHSTGPGNDQTEGTPYCLIKRERRLYY